MRHLQGYRPVGAGGTRWVTGGVVQERAMQPPADLLTAPTGTITAGLLPKQPAFGSPAVLMLWTILWPCLVTCNHIFFTRCLAWILLNVYETTGELRWLGVGCMSLSCSLFAAMMYALP